MRSKTPILNNINGYPLDEYQSRVVLSDEIATLVVAGAGSGKSLTIIGKIVYLVKVKHINPEDILCISFTNDATINLKNNIQKNYNFNLDIYTFHKLALYILKEHNISYNIAPDNYLDNIIEHFFNNVIPTNKLYQKALRIILGKKYSKGSLLNLKRLIKTFINLYKSNNYNISYFNTILHKIKYTIHIKKYYHNKYLLLLIINIFLLYNHELKEEESLDFNDMINEAINILKSRGLNKKWKYIIVDEYQDTSLTKFQLLDALIKLCNAKFLAVGDDFQSIYRFTGCNLSIFLDFHKYFTHSKTFQIVNTYRNPQELINIAGSFIMRNPKQQKKKLISPKNSQFPLYIYFTNNYSRTFKKLLITLSYPQSKEIMVLGRNNRDILNYIDKDFTRQNDKYTYKTITFRYLTIHKSKGLESDIVIILNLENKPLGLPTQIKDEEILKYVNNTKDYYPYEEERRLFYVALTRSKETCYLIAPYTNESIFVKELLHNKKHIKVIKK